jgi:RecJ-like exonuclease
VEKQIAYVVTHKDGPPSKGVLPAAVAVTPLSLDSPNSHAVTDQAAAIVAGQTATGASVKVNGEAVALDGAGTFTKSLPLSSDLSVDVEATAPQQAPRIVHVAVRRTTSYDAEAKAAESLPHLSYDEVKDTIAQQVGKTIIVEGEIVDTRLAGHQTILVVTDHRGCAGKADPNSCLARVLFGGEDKRKKGDIVRVFGRVTRAVPAQNGKNVPEIEADFLAKPRGR